MPTYATNWSVALLRAMLRATFTSGYTVDGIYLIDSGNTMRRYRLVNGTSWDAAANGAIALAGVPASTTASSAGTLAGFALNMASLSNAARSTSPGAATASPAEIILSSLDASTAVTINDFRIGLPKTRGTVSMNLALRNKLLETLVAKNAAHFSANGTLKVYDGSAPDVDAAPTGTELISFTIQTTNPYSFADVSADACALVSSISATAAASGNVGYARLSWTHNSVEYVIQGTVGTAGTDFIMDASALTGGNSYNLTNATISFA